MKYMFTIYVDEDAFAEFSPEEQQAGMKMWEEFTREATEAGVHLAGEGLAPSSTATTLRTPAPGEHVISDGPYAETKEALGGFYLFECADLDEAIAWAKRIPYAGGGVEVRPVMDYEGADSTAQAGGVEARR